MPQSTPPYTACHASPPLTKFSSKTKCCLQHVHAKSAVSTEGTSQVHTNPRMSEAEQSKHPAGRNEVHGGPGRPSYPLPTDCRQHAHPSQHGLRETGPPLPTLFLNLLQSLCETPACPLPSIFQQVQGIFTTQAHQKKDVISSPVYGWISFMFKLHHGDLSKKRKNR